VGREDAVVAVAVDAGWGDQVGEGGRRAAAAPGYREGVTGCREAGPSTVAAARAINISPEPIRFPCRARNPGPGAVTRSRAAYGEFSPMRCLPVRRYHSKRHPPAAGMDARSQFAPSPAAGAPVARNSYRRQGGVRFLHCTIRTIVSSDPAWSPGSPPESSVRLVVTGEHMSPSGGPGPTIRVFDRDGRFIR
jgi:hypothetical protein